MSFRWWSRCVTDAGKRRRMNEDSYREADSVGVWVVADGMGGHLRGDVASKAVTDAFADVRRAERLDDAVRDARRRLATANREIQQLAAKAGGIMGSTVVVFIVLDGQWACLWAGDSRAYRLSRGHLSQITHDHSAIQELLDRGDDAATIDPRLANRITRAVGVTPQLVIDEARGAVRDGDVILLCSDGLVREVADDELTPILDAYDCDEAAQRLLGVGLERGARDNITIAIVRFESVTGTRDTGHDLTARTQEQQLTTRRAGEVSQRIPHAWQAGAARCRDAAPQRDPP